MRALIAVSLLASCYSPKLGSPGYYCHPNDDPACPEGQKCLNGRCVDKDSDMGVALPDMSGPRNDMSPGDGGGGSCAATTMCMGTAAFANVNADDGVGGAVMTMGTTSQWLTVQAIEHNNGLVGQHMRLKVTLIPPASPNFDLYVYRNNGGTTPECASVAGSSTNASGQDVVDIDWGETDGDIPNGVSDNALVTIEVRAAAGAMCSQQWQLVVKGGP
jgi:hypothetical protein